MAERRDLLATTANPGERYDYMVILEGCFAIGASDYRVTAALRYVADRRLLPLDAFNGYLDSLAGDAWPTLEAVAITMLSDVNNELIPRWAQIKLVAGPGERGDRHSVIIEDCQPGWDNPTLLARTGA
ncbi:MAG: hypothetical protein IIC08_01755 [Proteobacteria bacterium]|nr:hypothetical protein [Pseudomonadota bacterium]